MTDSFKYFDLTWVAYDWNICSVFSKFQIKDELNTIRFGAHVDTYGLTMLMLDPEHPEGLQVLVKTPNGEEWVDVPYIENSIVINVGALLSRWTGEYIETE